MRRVNLLHKMQRRKQRFERDKDSVTIVSFSDLGFWLDDYVSEYILSNGAIVWCKFNPQSDRFFALERLEHDRKILSASIAKDKFDSFIDSRCKYMTPVFYKR